MSLGRLLTSGKSLIGLQNTEGRYEMRSKNLLPKFGSPRNPFNTARPEPLQVPNANKVKVEARVMTPAESTAAALKETRRMPDVKAVRSESESAPATKTSNDVDAPSRFQRLIGWLRSWLPGRRERVTNQSGSAVPRFDKAPVQTELSLDRIRVVRNDLSEADVEVVPVKISVQPKSEPAATPTKAPETAELIKS